MADSAVDILRRYEQLKQIKQPLEPKLDAVAEFIFPVMLNTSLASFGDANVTAASLSDPTTFSDGTAYKAGTTAASAIMGSMWPNGAKSLQIQPPYMFSKRNQLTKQEKDYYEFVTDTTVAAMDNPRAGLQAALMEYQTQLIFLGTSAVGRYKGPDSNTPIIFKAYCCKDLYIASNPHGVVDTVYTRWSFTVRNVVQEFGYENVSKTLQKKFDDKEGGKDTKVTIVHFIGPRTDRNPKKRNAQNMPVASVYIEAATKHIVRSTGYEDMPIYVGRFEKLAGTDYGSCPGLAAMSDIAELNELKELFVRGCENIVGPLKVLNSDSILGAETLNLSPGATIMTAPNARFDGQKPLEVISFTGDMRYLAARITELSQSITDHFHVDKLLDLNNETMMTATESVTREKLRGEAINSIFTRQEVDLFNPLIEGCVNDLFHQGLLGVIEGSPQHLAALEEDIEPLILPERVAAMILAGADFFDIKYISPAARIRKSDELQGMIRAFEALAQLLPIIPELADEIGVKMIWPKLVELNGAPIELVEDGETVQGKRDARQQQMQQMQEAEAGRNDSEIARNMGNALSSVSGKGG